MKFGFRWLLLVVIFHSVLASPLPKDDFASQLANLRKDRRSLESKDTTANPLIEDAESLEDVSKKDDLIPLRDKRAKKDTSKESDDKKTKSNPTTDDSEDIEKTTKSPRFNSNETAEDSNSDPNTEEVGDSKSKSDVNTSKCKTRKDSNPNEKSASDCEDDEVTKVPNSGEAEETHESSAIEAKVCGTEGNECKKLLVILASGLRHDYTNDPKLKGFAEIEENGVQIEKVKPVFPSNKYPTLYSIMTGRYPENHDIVNDYMYDLKRKAYFDDDGRQDKHFWDKAEPIWITAKERKVALYWWPGCDVEIGGRPSKCVPYDDLSDDKNRDQKVTKQLEQIVDDFKEDKYSLAMVYYDYIDHVGEEYGPRSKEVSRAVRKFDDILEELIQEIRKEKMDDHMNVVILSDHGMTKKGRIIQLERYIDPNDVEIIAGQGAFSMILPENDKIEKIYNDLLHRNIRGLNVYSKENLKSEYHLKKSSHLLPIILTTDRGYLIEAPEIRKKVIPVEQVDDEKGHHGYHPNDVSDMYTTAYAFGPSFKKNYTLNSVKQIDFYRLFCRLLDITPKKHDARSEKIEDLLISDSGEEEDGKSAETEETTTEAEQLGAIVQGDGDFALRSRLDSVLILLSLIGVIFARTV